MEIIQHRRNKIDLLISTPNNFGVEIDIRTYKNRLIIHHDPCCEGIDFEEWLKFYNNGTLILNVKEEGLEKMLLNILEKNNIEKFFFLDQSFPFLIKTSKQGEKRCAVRFSEYESLETVLNLKGLIDWVWVDFFNKFPLDNESFIKLKDHQFKICLVSPELQGFGENKLIALKRTLRNQKINVDAVCTKYPYLWKDLIC
tara:strand:+ start:47171 stop:47767 length:597 start_codon:yes stop_codon:yes gene_type:complete